MSATKPTRAGAATGSRMSANSDSSAGSQTTGSQSTGAHTTARLPIASGLDTLRVAWAGLRGRRRLLLAAALASAIGAALRLVTPAVLGTVVDDVTADRTGAGVWVYGVQIAAGSIGAALFSMLGIVLAARALETLLATLREQLVAGALAMRQSRVERSGTGDLVSRASDDVARVSEALSMALPMVSSTVFTIVLTLVGLSALDWRYGVAFIVVIPVYVVAMRWYLRTAPPMYAAERAATGTRAGHVLTGLHGLDTVLAYRLGGPIGKRIATSSWNVSRWSMRSRTVQTMLFGRLDFAYFLGLAVLLLVALWLVGAGWGTLGAATAAMLLYLQLSNPIRQLMTVADTVQDAAASLTRIVGVVQAAQEDADAGRTTAARTTERNAPATATASGAGAAGAGTASAADSEGAGPAVALRGVTFAYPGGPPVLHDVSLTITPGQHVAIVGASGAGKSTVAALLAGIHDPSAGSVLAPDDTVLITQESHVFTGTLRENLTLAAPDADDDSITAALHRVGAQDLLAQLPQGLDTRVGSTGTPLDAAVAQHLALARLVLADPQLAILDEATAEAGSAHADTLDRAAAAALAGRIGIVIAHRLSQAATCDAIIVMAGGRIVESGTQEELVSAGGHYSRLWEAWSAG